MGCMLGTGERRVSKAMFRCPEFILIQAIMDEDQVLEETSEVMS